MDAFDSFLFNFFDRYLAGASSIEGSRSVSRRQMALAKALSNGDACTVDLLKDIRSYQRCVSFLTGVTFFDFQALTQAHRLLFPNGQIGGRFRRHPSFVNIDNSGTQLTHEPHSSLLDRLSLILDFANTSEQPTPDKAINIYFKLLHAHPFSDGNGRLSRAIVQSLFTQGEGFRMHPSLFRFQCPPEIYFSSVKNSSEQNFKHHQETFFIEAKKWEDVTSPRAIQLCKSTLDKIHSKLGLFNLNKEEKELLDALWEKPVVSEKNMEIKTKKAVIRLMDLNILKAQQLSFSKHTIFVCDEILDCWDSLDNLLMKY